MALTRMIGIDFGTSTTVMKVKNYMDSKPIGDTKDVKSVVFENGASMVPTLIRKNKEGKVWYGYDAVADKKGTELFKEFKVCLENPETKQQAKELTSEFFTYLHSQYDFQSQSGLFGTKPDEEITTVSFPVKWSKETREFMIEAAKNAGFTGVRSTDEAEAAIRSMLIMCSDQIQKRMQPNKPLNILLVDMGAGTTDLVLSKCTWNNGIENKMLSVWPKEGGAFFGGKEVDKLLENYIATKLPEDDCANIIRRVSNKNQFKVWKETYVSPALKDNSVVEEFGELDGICDIMEIESPQLHINRSEFENAASSYLPDFVALIKDCLADGNVSADDVDLIILTGGHSNWYFVEEILCDKLPKAGTIGLKKIINEPNRIIHTACPQETVSIGLVMENSLFRIETTKKDENNKNTAQSNSQKTEGIDYEYFKNIVYSNATSSPEDTEKICDIGRNMLINHNNDEGFKYVKYASENGSSNGAIITGFCYDLGLGVAKDTKAAESFYRQGAISKPEYSFCYDNEKELYSSAATTAACLLKRITENDVIWDRETETVKRFNSTANNSFGLKKIDLKTKEARLSEINRLEAEVSTMNFTQICNELNQNASVKALVKMPNIRIDNFLSNTGIFDISIKERIRITTQKTSQLAYYDDTFFGTGTNGFLMTKDTFYYKKWMRKIKIMSITPDCRIEFDTTGSEPQLILVNRKHVEKINIGNICSSSYRYDVLFKHFFNEIVINGIEKYDNLNNR